MNEILILYYSRDGSIQQLANIIARGCESVAGCQARLRTVPAVSEHTEKIANDIPDSGAPYATLDDLRECAGLILGSPVRFGNMAAPMKHFIDSTSGAWISGDLVGKPAAVFTSSGSLHGGQEATLLSMMIPLFHHGMILLGLSYQETELYTTRGGGTPYGVSHHAGIKNDLPITKEEKALCLALGARMAKVAMALKNCTA